MTSLSDKVCVVSGASRGIGRAIALRLAAEGANVAAIARDAGALAQLAARSSRIVPCPCDVSREEDTNRAIAEIERSFGWIDVLVNNAGIGVFGPIESTAYDDFLRVMAVNAGGAFLLSRAVVPLMKRRRQGDIVNIASVVGSKGYALQSAYGASKHAVMGLTKALAAELHEHGIRVRAVSPGGVDTDLAVAARPDLDRAALIRPEDIAEIVVFLLRSPEGAVIDSVNVRRRGSPPWF